MPFGAGVGIGSRNLFREPSGGPKWFPGGFFSCKIRHDPGSYASTFEIGIVLGLVLEGRVGIWLQA